MSGRGRCIFKMNSHNRSENPKTFVVIPDTLDEILSSQKFAKARKTFKKSTLTPVWRLSTAASKWKADFKIVATKIGGAIGEDAITIEADFQLAGGSSVLFDHIFVALSEPAATALMNEAAAVEWIHNAFQYLKVIGATEGAWALLQKAGIKFDEGIVMHI